MKILVADDERGFADGICDNLVAEGYEAECVYGGQAALDAVRARPYQLLILDVMMPDLDGFSVLETVQRERRGLPVILLTARSTDEDKVRGLGLGADDYITKPFNLAELIVRVRNVLRRTVPGSELQRLRIGSCDVDFAAQTLKRSGTLYELGRYEVALLRLLASTPGKVFSRDEILDRIWGLDAYPTNRTVDNYVVKLRRKLELSPSHPKHLISVYGSGYKLDL